MEKILEGCPSCKELLVHPRNSYCYCEDCGWPEEDETQEFIYPKDGERLEDAQPFLEFYNGTEWVKSGVEFAIMRNDQFRGLYRYPYSNALTV